MKLLILGGTAFLGRHIVEQALEAGHDVTLFNRGQTNPTLFDGQVEKLVGDRAADLGKLAGQRFGACIDPSGYLPGQLETSGSVLRDSVDRYVFISSISVYPEFTDNLDETATIAELPADADAAVFHDEHYGALKVLCERAIEAAMPGRVLHVRSGLIVGPYDPTNRFTYWPARVQKGGDMLAPAGPGFPVQIIHAADQARWILHMLEQDEMGVYNVTSDNGTYTLGDVIDVAAQVTDADARPVWVPDNFLTEQGVQPWMELPLWLPTAMLGMSRVSAKKAFDQGLSLMSLEETIRSTLEWYRQQPEQDWPAGLDADKEKAALEAWWRTLR
jgi:2'-hydroxyisoflavone reductase